MKTILYLTHVKSLKTKQEFLTICFNAPGYWSDEVINNIINISSMHGDLMDYKEVVITVEDFAGWKSWIPTCRINEQYLIITLFTNKFPRQISKLDNGKQIDGLDLDDLKIDLATEALSGLQFKFTDQYTTIGNPIEYKYDQYTDEE